MRYYHADRVGSTLTLTDAGGNVTDAYAYDPHGRLLRHEGASLQPFTFVGRYGVRQEGAGGALYQMRARYYDARTGRFLSREPLWPQLGNPAALNPYAYADNDPVGACDPSGLLALHEILARLREFDAKIEYAAALDRMTCESKTSPGMRQLHRALLNLEPEDDPNEPPAPVRGKGRHGLGVNMGRNEAHWQALRRQFIRENREAIWKMARILEGQVGGLKRVFRAQRDQAAAVLQRQVAVTQRDLSDALDLDNWPEAVRLEDLRMSLLAQVQDLPYSHPVEGHPLVRDLEKDLWVFQHAVKTAAEDQP